MACHFKRADRLSSTRVSRDAGALKILIEARRAIAEIGWTQELYARDGRGYECHPRNVDAVCFCSIGALVRASDGSEAGYLEAETVLSQAMGGFIIPFNDEPGRTKGEILAAFDRAIASAERSA